MFGKGQAQTAIGAGDENGRHVLALSLGFSAELTRAASDL
jgi:hypothetical protein